MNLHEAIIKDIIQYIDLQADEIDLFISLLKYKKYKKRQFLVQAGDDCKLDFFITKGLVKEYFTDVNGKDFIFRFVKEHQWTCDYESYLNNQTATMNIEALEDVEAFCMSHADFEFLVSQYPRQEKCYRIYFQQAYISLQKRLYESLCKTANERYQHLITTQPDLLQRVSGAQIAAYLGVTPEFLSKIRQKK